MIKIEVESSAVDERSGVKNGKAWTIREQMAWAHVLGDDGKTGKYPVACRIGLEDGQAAYSPGNYTFGPNAVMVGEYDKLTLGRVKLVPFGAGPKQ